MSARYPASVNGTLEAVSPSTSRPSTSRLVRGARLLSLPGAALGDAATGQVRRLRGDDPAAVGRELRAQCA